MQLLMIALALGVYLHDAVAAEGPMIALPAAVVAGVVALPKIVLAIVYAAVCRSTAGRLAKSTGHKAYRRLDRFTIVYPLLLMLLYALDLMCGLLHHVRSVIGDYLLADELLTMLPTLAMVYWAWWWYYPVDRQAREARVFRAIDEGGPVYPVWSRGQFIVAQTRHQLALLLLPLLLILGWSELVLWLAMRPNGWVSAEQANTLTMAGAGAVLLVMPVVLRWLWDTTPLAPGPLREGLEAMCRGHGVKVRELLLWRTFGGMANAAVMGLVGPLRYILLSDALLDRVEARHVEAVMAHELAHIKKKHMLWLLLAAGALAGLGEVAVRQAASVSLTFGSDTAPLSLAGWLPAQSPEVVVTAGVALGWVVMFGWVSRRVERQADVFAVRHLAQQRAIANGTQGTPIVDASSIRTMTEALGQIAVLNHIRPKRKSWRHGSIAWRQDYLRTLQGKRVDQLPIDAQMRWVNLASVLVLIGIVLVMWL